MATATRFEVIATHETPTRLGCKIRTLLDRQHALGIHAYESYESRDDAQEIADMLSERIDGLGTSTIYSVVHV